MLPGQWHPEQDRRCIGKLSRSPFLRFVIALAHALGRTITEIGEMDLDELALWAAWFAEYDPALRDDLRAGVIAATIANAMPFSRGGWKPEDFMPTLKPTKSIQSEAEMERAMIAWCANVGGEVKVEKQR